MPYIITRSDGTVITVPDSALDELSSSLALMGKGYPSYGDELNTNFIHLLENFASDSVPRSPIKGQLWYNTNDSTLRICPADDTFIADDWAIVSTAAPLPTDAVGVLKNDGIGELSWVNLQPVATSGLYSDLTGKPLIPAAYVLPAAGESISELGGVYVDNETIKIDTDGKISLVAGSGSGSTSPYQLPVAGGSAEQLGGVYADNETIKIATDGKISLVNSTGSGATPTAATVTVGVTTTGAAGTMASVTNTGTTSAAILNFTIPRGDAAVSSGTVLPTVTAGFLKGASDGTLSWASVPMASSTVLGSVKVPATGNIGIDANGNLTASMPAASGTVAGVVKVGTGLSITDGVLRASTTSTGGVTLPISAAGFLKDNGGGILTWDSLPAASTTVAGVVKVGTGLSITDGVLRASTTSTGVALPADAAGVLKNNGTGGLTWTALASVATSGKYTDLTDVPSLPKAGTVSTAVGGVYVDNTTIKVATDGKISVSLPKAGIVSTAVGGVYVDNETIKVDTDGKIRASIPKAGIVSTAVGGVYVDNTTIKVATDGKISASIPTAGIISTAVGGVYVDNATIKVATDGKISASIPKAGTVSTAVGGVYVDNTTIKVATDGKISATTAGVSVTSYGAVGDGVTDDTISIQNAINYAQDNDLIVELVEGKKYKIISPLTFKHGRSSTDTKSYHAKLRGNNALILPTSAIANDYAIKVVPRCIFADRSTGRGTGDIEISGIWFDGLYSGATTKAMKIGQTGYWCDNWQWGSISDITTANFNGAGSQTMGPAGEIRFEECRHIAVNRLVMRSSSVIFETKLASSFTGDIMLYSCDFGGNKTYPPLLIKSAVAGGEVRGIHFQDCDIYFSGTSISASSSASIGDIWFSNCQFDGPGSPAGEWALGISGTDTSNIFQIHILSCYFVNYTSAAIHITKSGTGTVKQININGGGMNLITGNTNSGNAAIYCFGVTGVSIRGVQFDTITATNVIALTSCTDMIVTDNQLTNSLTTADYGVTVGGTGTTNYSIMGNILKANLGAVNDYSTGSPVKQILNNIDKTAASGGGTASTNNVVSVKAYGAVGNGVNDDTAAINAALAAVGAAGGGEVVIPQDMRCLVDSGHIIIPARTVLKGFHTTPAIGTQGFGFNDATLNAIKSTIILNSSYSIKICHTTGSAAGGVKGLYILRKGLRIPTTDLDAQTVVGQYAGTAVWVGNGMQTGNDCYVGYCHIAGFNQAIYGNGCGRHVFEHITGDNTNGIHTTAVFDVGRTMSCHFWGFVNQSNQSIQSWRNGIAFRFAAGNDWSEVSNCFSFGYKIGFQLEGWNMSLYACGSDAFGSDTGLSAASVAARAGTKGFYITGGASGIALTDCKHASHEIGYQFDASLGKAHRMIGCTSWSPVTKYHVSIEAGRVMIDDCLLYDPPYNAAIKIGPNAAGYMIDNTILDSVGKAFEIDALADQKGSIGYNMQYVNTSTGLRAAQYVNQPYGVNNIGYGIDNAPLVNNYFARGSVSAKTATAAYDALSSYRSYGWSGAAWMYSAGFRMHAQANFTTNSAPTNIIFSTAGAANGAVDRIMLSSDGHLTPISTNNADLGATGVRWRNIYLVNAAIVGSDQRLKTEIATATLGLEFINKLRPVSYKLIAGENKTIRQAYLDKDGVEIPEGMAVPKDATAGRIITEVVPGTRTHWGLIAQEVKAALEAVGNTDFAGWTLADKDDATSQQSLRYEEFISPMIKAMQELSATVNELKDKIAVLEAKVK